MTIKVSCACGKSLSVKDELAGKRVKCPACQQAISVPKPRAEAESPDDEWDMGDSASDDFDDEPPRASMRSGGGKKSASLGAASRKGKPKGKPSSGGNGGLLIGLSAGGGLLVVALLAWMLWPTKPGPNVAAVPNNNSGSPSTTGGDVTNTTNTAGVTPGPPPTSGAVNPPAAAPATTGATKLEGDLNLLQGTWQVTDVSVDPDQPGAENLSATIKQITWTIKDDILTMSRPEGALASTLKLDSTQTPKAIDLFPLEQNGREKGPGIYSLEGDSWKLCLPYRGTVRPTEMKPDKALGLVVLTLKRGSPPAVRDPTAAASGTQFDHKAWQQASEKLKAMKVFSGLANRVSNDSSFPDGLTHYAVIDPPATADGSISAELWGVISSVSHVVVRTQSVADATLRQLSQHPGLVGLNFSGRSTITAAGIAELKKCPNLRSLQLSAVPVSAELLNAIAQLGGLRAFGINDAPVSVEMVAVIVRLDKLESLSLQNAGTTDDDVAQLAKLTKLKTLMLDKSKVTDKGLQSLKSLTGLTMLSVRELGLSPQAVNDFHAAVPKCRIFTR